MAKAYYRIRNRKINYKTRIPIRSGAEAEGFREEVVEEVGQVQDKRKGAQQASGNRVETGVDREEENEHHLQVILQATAAAAATAANATSHQESKAFIPTPDSTGLVSQETYTALYPPGTWQDPTTYIRFSDTVEESNQGPIYNMDEEDLEWLEDFNKRLPEIVANDKPPDLSEDNFELIISTFETSVASQIVNYKIDIESIQPYNEMEVSFSTPMRALKMYTSHVYDWWKIRKIQREGKPIMPQLDFDESNETNPYVCFRRRDLKTTRKTRRSDSQNMERLIRLRNDIHAAHALMVRVKEREQLKLESVLMEKEVFSQRCQLRALKRRLGEPDGDEDLLITKRENRRLLEESLSNLRMAYRKEVTASGYSYDEQKALKDQQAAIYSRINKEVQRKAQADEKWEDLSEDAYHAFYCHHPVRYWRTVEPLAGTVGLNTGKGGAYSFSILPSHSQSPIGHVRTSLRRRTSRGGRIVIDRIGPGRQRLGDPFHNYAPPLSNILDEDAIKRLDERFRYDSDSTLDFPASADPAVVDDHNLKLLVKRSSLVKKADVEALGPNARYLDTALTWIGKEDKPAHPVIPLGRPILPIAQTPVQTQTPTQAQQAQIIQAVQAQIAKRTQIPTTGPVQGQWTNGSGVTQVPSPTVAQPTLRTPQLPSNGSSQVSPVLPSHKTSPVILQS